MAAAGPWRRVFPRATTTGGAWFHASPVNSAKQGWQQICSFSSSSCRRWPPRDLQTQKHTQTQLKGTKTSMFRFCLNQICLFFLPRWWSSMATWKKSNKHNTSKQRLGLFSSVSRWLDAVEERRPGPRGCKVNRFSLLKSWVCSRLLLSFSQNLRPVLSSLQWAGLLVGGGEEGERESLRLRKGCEGKGIEWG